MIPRAVLIGGAVAVLVTTAACSSSNGGASSSSSAPAATSSAGPTATSVVSPSSSGPGATGASLPKTCAQIPTSVLLPYAKVALVKSFPRTTPGVSCEFASSDDSEIVILTVGPGSTSEFAVLKANTTKGPVTTAALHGVGQDAFTISRAGKVTGVDALTDDDATIALAAALPAGQVQALAAKLAGRY